MHLLLKFLFVVVYIHFCHGDPICCTTDQWEAHMFMDNGNAFIDTNPNNQQGGSPHVGSAYSYINATMMSAYDFTNERTYIQLHVTEISPLIPRPISENTTYIRDYKNGVEYQFSPGKCEKTKLSPLKRHCVPETAVLLGYGVLGKQESQVATYAYTLPDFPYQFQSTVTQAGKECVPVHVTYFVGSAEADSGAVFSLEVFDFSKGIRDPSIFDIPSQCKKAEFTKQKSRNAFLKNLPFL